VGKTTIVRASGLREVISYTTRPIRDGEKDGFDYHFRTHEWMNSHRDDFRLDWKTFGENIYGATDHDVKNCEIMVITLDSAIELRQLGVQVYIIWIDGPIREARNRNVNVANGAELMVEVDRRLANDGAVEKAADELVNIHRSLTMIADIFS
jgi:guanylate kinase